MTRHRLSWALCLLSLSSGAALAAPDSAKWNVNQPPGPVQRAQLDVRSGTWMSVDVSPDGRWLLFDLLGDIYKLPIEGGQAQALTHSMAWDMQPRFSPDGRQIAFVSDAGGGDNVWVMNADGSQAKALSTEDFRLLNNPVWHPSGRYIAARKHFTGTRSLGSGEIWLYHLDGGKGQALNDKPSWEKDRGEPALSPDGRWLYYSQDVTPGRSFEYNKDSNTEIFRIFRQDLREGHTEALVQGPGGAIRPTPSPDGRWLAFVRRVRVNTETGRDQQRTALFVKDLSTGRERQLWDGLERDMQEAWSVHGVYPGMAWTPDSRELVTWAQGKLWRVALEGGAAREIPFHVKDERELRSALRQNVKALEGWQLDAPFDAHMLRWVRVSPDGKQVVYSAAGQLWQRALPEGQPRRLRADDGAVELFPAFSRDGRQLVFLRWQDAQLGQLILRDLASGKETVLTPEPGKYLSPQLSPDGRQVVYRKARSGALTGPGGGLDSGIYVAPTQGRGAPVRITRDGEAPQWGADASAVYVQRSRSTSEVTSQQLLVRIDLSTRAEQELVNAEYANSFTLSPDGQWLGFVDRYHTYVLPLPQTGRPLSVGAQQDSLPQRRLDLNAGAELHWSGDSRTLHYALGRELFSVAREQAFAPGFTPPERGLAIGPQLRTSLAPGRVALVGARLLTLRANAPEEVIENGTVLVENGRIAAIGARDSVPLPPNTQVVDASGKTIIPGLIDIHWHGAMAEQQITPQQNWQQYASLAFGVTTLHDPSNNTGDIFTQAERQRAGLSVGPRVYSTGTILYGARAPIISEVRSLADALTHLRRQQAAGAFSVKSYNQPRREQRQQILEAARQTGMMVVPEGGSLFQMNMSMLIDGHTTIEHALPVAKVYEDVLQLWPQTGVAYTPTLNVAYGGLDGEHYWYARTEVWKHPLLSRFVPRNVLQPRAVRRPTAPDEDYNVLQVARTATQLARAGVRVNIGGHGQREGLGAHWEMWMLGLGGMRPLEALRAATLSSAQSLGLDAHLGSLEVGKLADLVVLNGDVLKDIRQSDRIHAVMQSGRLYSLPRLDEVWPRQRARAAFFFEGRDAQSADDDGELTQGHGHQH
ncbi:amidohydrolase family protein [Roseateles sp. BYS180W]|uniref:Amidohydrolase family protein n=1 Tax=Roseateles rivi TaxID=3299028 RepID=A0ABW7FSQ0_9BURK